ncbi:MAG TPA: MASE1 domain-containing protein [Steroidobacteraceae bacterium]|nr:MASE1 domain-containing protein [Steroidobacteraceae bacterium]HEX5162239.1 MASE1 domain-containing protein [Steroidobacteraceae bacterium]
MEATAVTAPERSAVIRTATGIVAAGVIYYFATRMAWLLTFPDSTVSLFFPPHAVMVSILLLVPTRRWWTYLLAAVASHFIATQHADWPPLFALQSEAFDALKIVLTAAGIRFFIRTPLHLINLREAVLFVLVAVICIPLAAALWGASVTMAFRFGAGYWTEWRNLAISNAVTTIVLVPAIMIGVHLFRTGIRGGLVRYLEAGLIAAGIVGVGWLAFDHAPAGPDTSPALLYAPIPLLIWAALRFGPGGMSASVLLITMIAIWGTMQGNGPFLTQTPTDNALALQLFILFAATPLLLLAVAIEDERRSTEALRVSEQRMTLAAESAQLALWDWDLAADVVYVEDQGLFGFPRNTPIDHATLGGTVHPDDRSLRDIAIERARANGGTYDSEFRVVLPDGSVRWIAARGRSPAPMVDGRPSRILGIAIDTTGQRKAAADAQLEREELAHLSRVATMSALSVSLAHELNQPLTSILVNTHAGQSIMAHERPDLAELRAIFLDIDSAASSAGEIIERLRTLLRRGQVELKPVDVKASLAELLLLLRTEFIARGVSVSDLSGGELPRVRADRVQLQQILLNLIKNACDAMQGNPPEERRLTLTTRAGPDELCIGVLDTGVGLPLDIDSIFQPFHSTKQGGLGMGLSICRALVSAHGGRLWAERREGRGAAFYVALPVSRSG